MEKEEMEKDCWNCGVAEEKKVNGTYGEKPCEYAEQMMRNPCRGWKPIKAKAFLPEYLKEQR
jgi:hypothetical protein